MAGEGGVDGGIEEKGVALGTEEVTELCGEGEEGRGGTVDGEGRRDARVPVPAQEREVNERMSCNNTRREMR